MAHDMNPVRTGEGSSQRTSTSQAMFDHFIGRSILDTEDIVANVRRIDPGAEMFDDDDLLVVPLMQRHVLSNAGEKRVESAVDRLLALDSPPLPRTIRAATGDAIVRPRRRREGPRRVVYLTFAEQGAPYSGGQYRREQRAVGSVLGLRADDTPFKIRIAETRSESAALRIARVLRDHDLTRGAVDLSAPRDCRAPKK